MPRLVKRLYFIITGPSLNPAWTVSGADVSRMVTLPANVTFELTDDSVALEETEVYTLTLLFRDYVVDITTINIIDDDSKLKINNDEKLVY